MNTKSLLLIALTFVSTFAKVYEHCEFAEELFYTHDVPKDEIYKHVCIGEYLHTGKTRGGHAGIYSIGTQWWCGEDEPGGSCKVKCSDLTDDDISDDVKCASLILNQQGLSSWGKTQDSCMNGFYEKTSECLKEVEIFENLQKLLDQMVDVPVRTTTADSVSSTVVQPTSTTRTEASTTTTSTAAPTTTTSTTTVRPTSRWTRPPHTTNTMPSTTMMSPQKFAQTTSKPSESEGSGLWWLLAICLLVVCVGGAFAFIKYRPVFQRHYGPSSHMEFENNNLI